jgi:hypothetical protein
MFEMMRLYCHLQRLFLETPAFPANASPCCVVLRDTAFCGTRRFFGAFNCAGSRFGCCFSRCACAAGVLAAQ